uniref:Maturase K n=1 Tax=Gastrodia angusta TaxID=2939659 RepID=A0A976YH99_9ASPA|nr:maturase K [Gastrodia angusta]UVG40829.1 maturase K [Gastrodia angusta]
MLSEGFIFILEIPLSSILVASFEKKKILRYNKLRSIHSKLTFLEDKISNLDYVTDILLPYPIHLGVLVKILRYWIKDTPSLHLLILFFYEYNYIKNNIFFTSNTLLQIKDKNYSYLYLIHNYYIYEFEYIIMFIQKKSSYLKYISYAVFLERIYFNEKIGFILKMFFVYFNVFPSILQHFIEDPLIHYVRYKGNVIILLKGNLKGNLILINKSKLYIVNLWQYSFNFWSQPYSRIITRIINKQLINYLFSYIVYFSNINILIKAFRIKTIMLDNYFIVTILIKELYNKISPISIIRSLAKANFCTIRGKPIGQARLTHFSDYDIIYHFCQIYKNLFYYHSGSSNKISLYRLKYILQISCAKTLTHKHKGKAHFFKKLELLEIFLLEKEKFPLFNLHKKRIWYLSIIQKNLV